MSTTPVQAPGTRPSPEADGEPMTTRPIERAGPLVPGQPHPANAAWPSSALSGCDAVAGTLRKVRSPRSLDRRGYLLGLGRARSGLDGRRIEDAEDPRQGVSPFVRAELCVSIPELQHGSA
jgi:hypothetical protein